MTERFHLIIIISKDATFNLYKDLIGILFIFDRSCRRLASISGTVKGHCME